MGTLAVEHETDEQTHPRPAAAEREASGHPGPEVAAQPALIDVRLLLGLQSRAGNAAVTHFIDGRKQPVAPAAPEANGATAAIEPQPETQSSTSATTPTTEDAPPEARVAEPAAGETDEDLAALDAAGDEATSGATADREIVAQDAQAEVNDVANTSTEPEGPSGGGEPGVAIQERPPPVGHDVSAAEPSSGLALVGSLPPAQLLGSLGSVAAAVNRQSAQEHQKLAESPPERPRHPGAPATVNEPASRRMTIPDRPAQAIDKIPEGHAVEVGKPVALPNLPEVSAPAGQLPTHDPGTELKPGPLPHLPSEGNADPNAVNQQRSEVLTKLQTEHSAAQQDAGHPLGEDQVFPTAVPETLRAALPQPPSANGHGAAARVSEDDEATSIIAQQERGGEIQSAVATGQASLAGQRQEYAQQTASERSRADAEMRQLEQANSQEQAAERAAVKRDVGALRGQWSGEQRQLVAGAQHEADAKTTETLATVAQERSAAEQQAVAHYQQGQQEADQARRHAEHEAAAEKQKAQSQGIGGVLGAIGSAAQGLFDKAKQAVQSVFDRARQLVRGAIERAQQLATAVLERARQAIVGVIRLAATALTGIGDRVLVAFPALRDRFRKLIQDRIAIAEATVNKLAGALKQAVQATLNLLGATLAAAIGVMQMGMQAAVEAVGAGVRGALDFARGAIGVLGTFAALIKDVAANPGQWISNLAAAAKDGIKNHLWPDLKAAVQSWFSDKVESVLGLGSAVWGLLKRGGITLVQVGKVAWEGLKAMIPQTVVWVLIEKLVSLIVPAAAAVVLIIQALQAAWSSIGRIIQAFDAFMAFLKGVRWGNAGPLFGRALAAGAVAVIEFISQFLLQRLMGAAGAVAAKLRSLAKRIGAGLAGAGRKVASGARALSGAASRVLIRGRKLASAAHRSAGDNWFMLKNRRLAREGMAWIESNGDRCIRHGPMNPGPLESDVAGTFRGSSYTARRLGQPKEFWRVYSDPKNQLGAYWTDLPPSGPLQSTIDSALHHSFKNRASQVIKIRVPAGQTVFEGSASSQGGMYLGGGPQFLLPKRRRSWVV